MAQQQTELDFSKRGHQLRLLRRIALPASEGPPLEDGTPGPKVRPASLLATLQAIDDCIGSDPEYCISVARLAKASGLARRTVQRAIHGLVALQAIDVQNRYRNGRQCSCRFRIMWIRLVDFMDETTGHSAAETFAPRGATIAPPQRNHCAPPAQPLRPRGRNHDAQPAQSSANTSSPSPPRQNGGEGTDLFWQKHTARQGAFVQAVHKRDHQFLLTAWTEAVAAGWQPDQRDIRRKFFAACFYAVKPPDGFAVQNPARLVRDKLIRSDWKTGRMDGADDDFARDIERRVEGTSTAPRNTSLDARPDTEQQRQAAVAQLRRHAAGKAARP